MYDMKALYQAESVQDAVALRVAHPDAQIIAGGSDVLVQIREGKRAGAELISIFGLDELRGVRLEEDGTLRYSGQWDNAYSGAQLVWLADTALHDAPEHVIFLEHIPFNAARHTESVRIGEDALDRITTAFVKGEKLRIFSDDPDFSYSIDADFSGPSHSVPARIAGHCHSDTVTYDKAGFLEITTLSAGRKISGVYPDDAGILYEREPYSANETSMDIFTFSPSRKMIFATRYGSGVDRKFPLL